MSEGIKIQSLVEAFENAERAVVFTGAGISTESGIPDFRSPGGLYSQIDPMEFLSTWALETQPEKLWACYAERFGPISECEPNQGHRVIAALEKAGLIAGCITQNIDGLHQKAGSKQVIELHGHLRTARCISCRWRCSLDEAFEQLRGENAKTTPRCGDCGEMMRPDVVLFGDPLEVFEEGHRLALDCELMIVVGSSLSVSPANSLAFDAKRLAIINRDPTEMDHLAEILIHDAGAGEILGELAERLGVVF